MPTLPLHRGFGRLSKRSNSFSMRNVLFVALFTLFAGLTAQAQKFGYVYSEELLSSLEDMKAAESDLMGYRDQQQKLFQTKVDAFQAEVADLQRKNEEGLLTPKQVQEAQATLQAKQQSLGEEEQKISEAIDKRRRDKIQPIFDKVNKAIEAVAKEDELLYVFDGSAGGVVLYADESMNITSKVQTKLSAM